MKQSIVEELQRDSLDKKIGVTELLRKALVVASKLDLDEFEEWISRELEGYKNDIEVPEYRNFVGTIIARNPPYGWIPVHFADSNLESKLSHRRCMQPLSELETLLEKKPEEGNYHMPFPHDVQRDLCKITPYGLPSTLQVSFHFIQRVVDTVRNVILKWTLKLEKDGILGAGLSFSQNEKTVAAQNVYHVMTFYGPVTGSQIQQATVESEQSVSAGKARKKEPE
jgi:hypothetical protein